MSNINSKSFANFAIGLFFIVSSLSLVIIVFMFIFVWQPIWAKGFNDFHMVSNAINRLDDTSKPAMDTIPEMLSEMKKMNTSMKGMAESVETMEEMTPAIQKMTILLDRLAYVVGRIERKLPSTDRLPFW